jgi:hypothetical protein
VVVDRAVALDKEVGMKAAEMVAVAALDEDTHVHCDIHGGPLNFHSIQRDGTVLPDSQN